MIQEYFEFSELLYESHFSVLKIQNLKIQTKKCENTFVKDFSVKKLPNKNCLQKGPGDEKVMVSHSSRRPRLCLCLLGRWDEDGPVSCCGGIVTWGIIQQGIGTNYSGNKNSVIVSGKEIKCQNWNALLPHRSMFLENENHNYCRNPNNDPQVGSQMNARLRESSLA